MVNKTACESLFQCAVQCREFVWNHRHAVDACSETIILGIDCAELCQQASLLARHKTAKSVVAAQLCIRTCESLLRHLSLSSDPSAHQLADYCLLAQRCCQTIIEQTAVSDSLVAAKSSVVCYGIAVPAGVYRA